jgi:hypothetical protein
MPRNFGAFFIKINHELQELARILITASINNLRKFV